MRSIIDGKPSNMTREAGVLGEMKDIDLFVRNTDAPMGIWASLVVAPPEVTDDYRQDWSWCAWRGDSVSELQTHSLVCPKKPITVQTTSPQPETPEKGTA